MRVKVKLFGPQARLVGARQIVVDLPDAQATGAGLREALARREPRLAPTLASSRVAVNHAFVEDADPIRPSDEVALIGLISGG